MEIVLTHPTVRVVRLGGYAESLEKPALTGDDEIISTALLTRTVQSDP